MFHLGYMTKMISWLRKFLPLQFWGTRNAISKCLKTFNTFTSQPVPPPPPVISQCGYLYTDQQYFMFLSLAYMWHILWIWNDPGLNCQIRIPTEKVLFCFPVFYFKCLVSLSFSLEFATLSVSFSKICSYSILYRVYALLSWKKELYCTYLE